MVAAAVEGGQGGYEAPAWGDDVGKIGRQREKERRVVEGKISRLIC